MWGAKDPTDLLSDDLQQYVRIMTMPPVVRTSDIPLGAGTTVLTPVVQADDVPPVGRMETIQPATPPDSVPMFPNCVRIGASQDVPDERAVFDVSPVTPGFLMRPSGTAVQQPVPCVPLSQALNTFSDPVLGDQIAFCTMRSGCWVGHSLDLASIYDAIRSCINAGTVFGSDGYGVGSVLSAGGVVLRYAPDF